MESPLTAVKRGIVHAYVAHMQRVANRHAEDIREMQAEAGRDKRLLIRFDAFESDVTKAGFVPQVVFTHFVRVNDGRLEHVERSDAWDGRVKTDVPVLVGIRDGYMDKRLPDGTVEHIEPFTPRRAWLMGHILTEGDASMLANLLLFEKRVWSELLNEIKPPRKPPTG
ncbi:MAG: hypothetical protein IVW52_05175 [Acidimicrobiales bacterium]|nr:hypothetical protein [Acidimicrobiales bacterium]